MSSTSRSVSQRHYYHRTECLPGPLSTSSPSLLVLKCHSVSAGILPVALDTVCLAKTQKGSNKWWLRVVHILWNQQSWAPTLGHHLMLSSTSCSRYSSCFVHTCIAWALCLCLKKFLPCQSHDPKNKPETHFPSFQWSQGAAIWSRLWESDALPRDFNEVESNRGKRTHTLFYSVCCCAGGNRSLQLWGTSPKKKKKAPSWLSGKTVLSVSCEGDRGVFTKSSHSCENQQTTNNPLFTKFHLYLWKWEYVLLLPIKNLNELVVMFTDGNDKAYNTKILSIIPGTTG